MVTKFPPIFFLANFNNIRDQPSTFASASFINIGSLIWGNYCRKGCFSFVVRPFDIIFASALSSDIGLLFLIYFLSPSFVTINLIAAWRWEIRNWPFSLACFSDFRKHILFHTRKFHKNLSSIHHYLVFYHFEYFLERSKAHLQWDHFHTGWKSH